MKRPTHKQIYEYSVMFMRGVNAITIWCIFAALIYYILDDLTRP